MAKSKEPWKMTCAEYRASLVAYPCEWSDRDWKTGSVTRGKFRVKELSGATIPATGETAEEAVERVMARHRLLVLDYAVTGEVPAEVLAEYQL